MGDGCLGKIMRITGFRQLALLRRLVVVLCHIGNGPGGCTMSHWEWSRTISKEFVSEVILFTCHKLIGPTTEEACNLHIHTLTANVWSSGTKHEMKRNLRSYVWVNIQLT